MFQEMQLVLVILMAVQINNILKERGNPQRVQEEVGCFKGKFSNKLHFSINSCTI
jgi:hypothetical protein